MRRGRMLLSGLVGLFFFACKSTQEEGSNTTEIVANDEIVDLSDPYPTNSSRRILAQTDQPDLVSDLFDVNTPDGNQELNLSIAVSAVGGLRRSAYIGHYNDSRGVLHTDATVATVENDLHYMQRLSGSDAEQRARYLKYIISTTDNAIALADTILDETITRRDPASTDEIFHTELRHLLFNTPSKHTMIMGSLIAGSGALQTLISLRWFEPSPASTKSSNDTINTIATQIAERAAEIDGLKTRLNLTLARNMLLRIGLIVIFREVAITLREYCIGRLNRAPLISETTVVPFLIAMAVSQLALLIGDARVLQTILQQKRAKAKLKEILKIEEETLRDIAKSVEENDFMIEGDGVESHAVKLMRFSRAQSLIASDEKVGEYGD